VFGAGLADDAEGVAAQIPARHVAELREDRADAGLLVGLVGEDAEFVASDWGGVENRHGREHRVRAAPRHTISKRRIVSRIQSDEQSAQRDWRGHECVAKDGVACRADVGCIGHGMNRRVNLSAEDASGRGFASPKSKMAAGRCRAEGPGAT